HHPSDQRPSSRSCARRASRRSYRAPLPLGTVAFGAHTRELRGSGRSSREPLTQPGGAAMAIRLDHLIVPSHEPVGAAKLLAGLGAPAAALGWLGRQGTRAIAALVFVAIAVPPIDALLKPFVSEAIFVLLCISFLRVNPAALRGYVGRPGLVLAATAWTMLVVPIVIGTIGLPIGL